LLDEIDPGETHTADLSFAAQQSQRLSELAPTRKQVKPGIGTTVNELNSQPAQRDLTFRLLGGCASVVDDVRFNSSLGRYANLVKQA